MGSASHLPDDHSKILWQLQFELSDPPFALPLGFITELATSFRCL
jgi:hypothetical protein